MGVKENEAALMRAVQAWNSGDVGSYLELYDERIKLHAGNYDFPNKASVAAMYQGMFAATSDIRLTMHETFGQDEKLCARYSLDARHTGKLMGIEPTGKPFSMIGITVMHFEGGKVVERWDIDNSSEVFAELRR
ncbi:MAG TPA: ester cyclase [Acidimicrobiia bacterium]|nr:ester cyclase [Acidimicrobiia bacterium]